MTPDELIQTIERGYPDTYCETCGRLVCQSCGYCKNLDCKDCICIELRRSCGFPDGTEPEEWEEFLRRWKESRSKPFMPNYKRDHEKDTAVIWQDICKPMR